MTMWRGSCIALLALMILFLSADVGAQRGRSLSQKFRHVGLTNSTSDCIGDPRTLACALDTFFACFVRRDHDLCARVAVPPPNESEYRICHDLKSVTYEINSTKVVVEDDLCYRTFNAETRQVERKCDVLGEIQPGDIEVEVFYVYCATETFPCQHDDALTSWTQTERMRMLPGRWRFVDSHGPGDFCPILGKMSGDE